MSHPSRTNTDNNNAAQAAAPRGRTPPTPAAANSDSEWVTSSASDTPPPSDRHRRTRDGRYVSPASQQRGRPQPGTRYRRDPYAVQQPPRPTHFDDLHPVVAGARIHHPTVDCVVAHVLDKDGCFILASPQHVLVNGGQEGFNVIARCLGTAIGEAHIHNLRVAILPERQCSTFEGAELFKAENEIPELRMLANLVRVPDLHTGRGIGIEDLNGFVGVVPLVVSPSKMKESPKEYPAKNNDNNGTNNRAANQKKPTGPYVFLGQVPMAYTAEQVFWVFVALTGINPFAVHRVTGGSGAKNNTGGFKVFLRDVADIEAAIQFSHCAILGDFAAFIGRAGSGQEFARWADERDARFEMDHDGAELMAVGPLSIERPKTGPGALVVLPVAATP